MTFGLIVSNKHLNTTQGHYHLSHPGSQGCYASSFEVENKKENISTFLQNRWHQGKIPCVSNSPLLS